MPPAVAATLGLVLILEVIAAADDLAERGWSALADAVTTLAVVVAAIALGAAMLSGEQTTTQPRLPHS